MKLLATRIRGPQTSYLYQPSSDPNAPLFFLIHGFPDDAYTFKKQFWHFKNMDMLAPFARGTPPSEMAQEETRYGPDSILLDNLHLIREIDPHKEKKILVMGHDIGGLYAWDLARHLGDRCLGLVVENGASIEQMAFRISNWRQLVKSWYILIFQIPGSKILWEQFEKRFISRAYNLGGSKEKKYPKDVSEGILQYREAFKEVLSFLITKKRSATLNKLQVPTLILCAKKDPFLEEVGLDELEKYAEKLTVRYIEGGHWAHKNNSEKVNHLIDKFIGEINGSMGG